MADTNASSDFLPPITRDRGDSIMSLGPGTNLNENGGAPTNGAGALASPTAPPDPAPPATNPQAAANAVDEKLVQEVLTSEVNF